MFQPKAITLSRYAQVLVNFALNGGKGLGPDEVVFLQIPECAKPMLSPLRQAILEAGGHCLIQYLPDNIGREFYQLASQQQLEFFPARYLKGIVGQADHFLSLIADTDKHELEGIEPGKIMSRNQAFAPYLKWRREKESLGKLSWTLALYGTEAMAKEVGLSQEEYWQQIIQACFLDYQNPIDKWRRVSREINQTKNKLDQLKIKSLQIEAWQTNLTIGLGQDRRWLGGSGNNIPSFEIFTSPDWHYTQGHIYFNQPLYIFGQLVEGVYLEFDQGKVTSSQAKKGEPLLKKMIEVAGANKVGEISLTDGGISKITKFMGETLYDENRGGRQGNTHLALGSAYRDCYRYDRKQLKKRDWQKLGFNDSVIHTVIVSTSKRKVTATLAGNIRKVIYQDGRFVI
jgi:aminopeptidase